MKGTTEWQTIEIFKTINEIGNSKHEAKNEARESGARGSHEIATKTSVYSYRTLDSYRESVAKFGNWAKENLHLRDLTKTTPEAAKAYLNSRIAEGVSHKTFQLDKASLNKFETALNKYSQAHNLNKEYNFKINETFKNNHKSLQHADVRAYDKKDVEKLLSIKNPAVNLAVRCALNAGLRKSEILRLSEKNLSGNRIEVIGGKGGKNRVVSQIHDKNLINDVKTFLKENDINKIGDVLSGSKINNEIRAALGNTGSIHRLRHNYAINTVKVFTDKSFYRVEAVHYTSQEIGHERNEIIETVYSK